MTTSSRESRVRMAKFKILVVDDHPVVREGLAWLVNREDDLEVCGGCDSLAAAWGQVQSLRPDVVVVDIALMDGNGIELIAQIKAHDRQIKMLVWSMFEEKVYAERAIRAGAMGYVNKRQPMQTVIDAIRQILDGQMYASPALTNSMLRRLSGQQAASREPVEDLSDRELEVFQMIGQGKTALEIAHKLGVKPATVESHREKIKLKLGLKNAAQLNCRAVQWVLENG